MAARRPRHSLRVYAREYASGERWWWVACPGDVRKALDLREGDVSKEDAHRIACERFAAGALVERGTAGPAEVPLRELTTTYLREEGPRWKERTAESYELLLAAFVEAMAAAGVTLASEVTSDVLSRYIAVRQAGTVDVPAVENATINRCLTTVRAMVQWGRAREPSLLPSPVYLERWEPLRELTRGAAPIIPSPDEWRLMVGQLAKGVSKVAYPKVDRYRVLSEVNDRGLALLVAVAVQTGERVDELRHMRDEDIGTDEVRVAAYEGWKPKSHRERTIPVPASTAKLARQFVAWRDSARGLNGTDLELGEGWINDRLDLAWKRLDIVGDAPRMHDCRRTFATELSRTGHPLTMIRDRMGHADVQTTERYLGRYRSDRDRVVHDMGIGSALGEG